MNITDLELKLINAITESDYSQEPHDAVWFWSVAQEFDSNQISGVVGSAVKKGLVKVQDEGTKDHIIYLTTDGLDIFNNQ